MEVSPIKLNSYASIKSIESQQKSPTLAVSILKSKDKNIRDSKKKWLFCFGSINQSRGFLYG